MLTQFRYSRGSILAGMALAIACRSAAAQPPAPQPVPAAVQTPPAAPASPPKQAEIKTPSTVPTPPEAAPSLSAPPQTEALPVVSPDRYFVLVFGAESVPKRGRLTHTWFTIVKATPNLDVENTYKLEVHTISWMPRSLHIRVIKFRPEPGVNLDLHRSIRFCRSQGECVVMWGPYELNPAIAVELYNKSLKQIAKLNSGCMLYKSLDPDFGPAARYTCNCIHAVTDLDGVARRHGYSEVRNNGIAASEQLARVMTGAGRVDWTVTHDWLLEALDIAKYCIPQRPLTPNCR